MAFMCDCKMFILYDTNASTIPYMRMFFVVITKLWDELKFNINNSLRRVVTDHCRKWPSSNFLSAFQCAACGFFTQFSNELSNACGHLRFARLLQSRSRRQKASASLRRKRRRSTTSKTTRRPTTKMSTRRRPPPQQQLLKDSLKVRAKRLNGWAITVMKKSRPPRPIPRSVDLAKAFAMKRS